MSPPSKKARAGNLQMLGGHGRVHSLILPDGRRMLSVTGYAVVNVCTRTIRCVYDDRSEAYQQRNAAIERIVKLTGSVVLPKWSV